MKRLGLLFVVMITFLMVPFAVFADEVNDNSNDNVQENGESSNNAGEKDKKVKVYFFRGDGCPHCAQAEKFFDSIKDEYGHLFELVDYEVYNNANNSKLFDKVADFREDNERRGIPYIIIGNKSWTGYASDLDSAIIEAIEKEYETPVEDRYDIMDLIKVDDENDYSDDAMILIIILIVVAGIVSGVMFARKKTV